MLRDSRIKVSQLLFERAEAASFAAPALSAFNDITTQGEFAMKQLATAALCAVLLSLVSAGIGLAQVQRVEMKIDGYLCGN